MKLARKKNAVWYRVLKNYVFAFRFYAYLNILIPLTAYLLAIPSAVLGLVDNGYIESLVSGMTIKTSSSGDQKDEQSKMTNIIKIMKENQAKHWKIFIANLFCQVGCVAIVIAIIFIIDFVLNGHFLTYGILFGRTDLIENFGDEAIPWNEFVLPPLLNCTIPTPDYTGKTLPTTIKCYHIWSPVMDIELLVLWVVLAAILLVDSLYILNMVCSTCSTSGRK